MGIQNSFFIQTIKSKRLRAAIVTLWDEDIRFALMCMLLLLTLVLGIFVGAKVAENLVRDGDSPDSTTSSVNLGQSLSPDRWEQGGER